MIIEDAKIVRKTSYYLDIFYDKRSPFIISAILIVYHILCFLLNPYMNIYWFAFVIVGTIFTLLLGLIYYTQ